MIHRPALGTWFALGLSTLVGASCGLDNGSGTRDGGLLDAGGDGAARTDGGGLDGRGNDAGDGAATDAPDGCGSNTFAVHPTPPNVLVLLDRSCSMRRTPDTDVLLSATGTGTSKWEIAVAALHDLTTTYASSVRWGLIYLPRDGTAADGVACGAAPVCGGTASCPEVAPANGSGPAVVSVIDGVSPFVGCPTGAQVMITPLDDALVAAGTVSQLHDATRADVVLMITDGEESCLAGDDTTVAPMLATRVAGLLAQHIKTAVVGFGAVGGATGGVDPVELNAMAMAGGLPATGATQYYPATDSASLHAALEGIIGSTLSCTFTLSGAVSDPSLLHVYVNAASTELPRDTTHAMGWDYDPSTHAVTLYGASCDDVHHARLTQLDVLQACPGGPPPPPPGMCHGATGACTTDADCCTVQGLVCETGSHVCILPPG